MGVVLSCSCSSKIIGIPYFRSMNWIDTHTHLYVDAFDEDRDQALERALALGINRFYLPAIDFETTERMFNLETQFPNLIRLMMGLHPTHVQADYAKALDHVEKWLFQRPFAAVGEIGVDLYWDQQYLKEQIEVFEQQIQWAKALDLPIVIHCRDAFDVIFKVLEKHQDDKLRGIFHCFTGTLEQALRIIGYGFKLGIGGVVTFKNGKLDQFIHQIPLSEIVLETDAPYLTPTPHRGKRNESAYLDLIAEKVAQCYGIAKEELSQMTTKTALSFFQEYDPLKLK